MCRRVPLRYYRNIFYCFIGPIAKIALFLVFLGRVFPVSGFLLHIGIRIRIEKITILYLSLFYLFCCVCAPVCWKWTLDFLSASENNRKRFLANAGQEKLTGIYYTPQMAPVEKIIISTMDIVNLKNI